MHMAAACIKACMNTVLAFGYWAISISCLEGIVHWGLVGVPWQFFLNFIF